MRYIIAIAAISMSLAVSANTVSALERTFDHPRYRDSQQFPRLDGCFAFGRECGQKVADSYCTIHGFAKAARFELEKAKPTKTIGDRKECDANFCTAFRFIVCFTPSEKPGPVRDWPQGL